MGHSWSCCCRQAASAAESTSRARTLRQHREQLARRDALEERRAEARAVTHEELHPQVGCAGVRVRRLLLFHGGQHDSCARIGRCHLQLQEAQPPSATAGRVRRSGHDDRDLDMKALTQSKAGRNCTPKVAPLGVGYVDRLTWCQRLRIRHDERLCELLRPRKLGVCGAGAGRTAKCRRRRRHWRAAPPEHGCKCGGDGLENQAHKTACMYRVACIGSLVFFTQPLGHERLPCDVPCGGRRRAQGRARRRGEAGGGAASALDRGRAAGHRLCASRGPGGAERRRVHRHPAPGRQLRLPHSRTRLVPSGGT
eukprot:scaffold73552_cov63-Phaeocystis_antarctica.AAC.2